MSDRILILFCVAVLAFTAAPAVAGQSRIVKLGIPAPSLNDPGRTIRVYLPPSYSDSGAQDRRYPVVFLLHGWPGKDGNWPGRGHARATLDSLIATRRIPEVIAVMPRANGRGFLGRSLYLNSWDGRVRMEDFITRDLTAFVDSAYRTRPEARYRGLIGLSDGGSGAVNLAFKHRDVFGACGSHSGGFRLARHFGEKHILGPDSTARRLLVENSPLDYAPAIAESLRDLSIYFDCGSHDGELGQNRELDSLLTRLGVPHVYHEFKGGHTWRYWRSHLHESLETVCSRMW